jgi:hypothetical protein
MNDVAAPGEESHRAQIEKRFAPHNLAVELGAAPLHGAVLHLMFRPACAGVLIFLRIVIVRLLPLNESITLAETGARPTSPPSCTRQNSDRSGASRDRAEQYTSAHVPEPRSIEMAERRTFAPLHPTRKYVSAGIERDPLPKELCELVERLRKSEPIEDPRENEARGQEK